MILTKLNSFRYAHVIPGYIGKSFENLTLNSQFFSLILNNRELLNKKIIFPQRIPKVDFFEELQFLESNEVKTYFNQLVICFKNHVVQKNINEISLLNYLKILLRYGCSEYVAQFQAKIFFSDELKYEIKLLQICAQIELDLSISDQPSLIELQQFTDQILNQKNITKFFKVQVLNRLIVNYFRYMSANQLQIKIEIYVKIVLNMVLELPCDTNQDKLFLAYAYRGIAMSSTISKLEKEKLIKKSEAFSRQLHSEIEFEKIIYKENLYTTLQTIAKYELLEKNMETAIDLFTEMIKIDPNDSTAYSELGLLLLELENYRDAADLFAKASSLGPPGVGMNLYYEAKCYQNLLDDAKFVSLLKEAAVIDPFAISPQLDLFEYYKISKNSDEAKKIANKIINNSILLEQLNSDEQKELTKHANTI